MDKKELFEMALVCEKNPICFACPYVCKCGSVAYTGPDDKINKLGLKVEYIFWKRKRKKDSKKSRLKKLWNDFLTWWCR